MSNLRDLIRVEIERGNLSEVFKVADLRALVDRNRGVLGDEIAPESLNSYLANYSTGPAERVGEAVKRGGAKLFKKHAARATYSLDYSVFEPEVETDSEAQENDLSTGNSKVGPRNKRGSKRTRTPNAAANSAKPSSTSVKDQIALKFVEYLREKPFRQLRTSGGKLIWGPPAVTGWDARVNAYQWNGSDWRTTSRTVGGFINDLKIIRARSTPHASIAVPARQVYEGIRKWGNPKGRRYTGPQLEAFLQSLWKSENKITQVDSTLTKLYAFAEPDAYAIYDSRVAAAIMTIAEDIYRLKTVNKRVVDTVQVFRSQYPHLGLYAGVGGTRQRGYRSGSNWPQAYRSIAAQYDANDLCVRIRAKLNALKEDGRSTWTLREVEAVLFMEGY